VLPLPFSIRDLTVMVAAGAFIMDRVVSGRVAQRRKTFLDFILWVNLGYLAITVVIHPVGFYAFGAEKVGARSIFDIVLAAVAFYVVVRLPDKWTDVGRIPLFLLVGGAVLSLLYLSAYVVPALPEKLPYLYAALDIGTFFNTQEAAGEIPRYKRLADGGLALVLALCAYYPPNTLLNPLRVRFYWLLLGLAGVMASGFRSVFLWVGVAFVVGGWLWGKTREVALVGILFFVMIAGLVMGHGRLYSLPAPAQRTLSFLPGRWEVVVAEEAENSSKVRFAWWRDIIKGGVINNWWIGDGFGGKVSDLLAARSDTTGMAMQTVSGAFHNGPLTTIRYCGIIGLVLFYVLAITCAVLAVRCARRARGTPLQPAAIYLGIQLVWIPANFTLVFGAYNVDMPQQIMWAGFLLLLVRALDSMQPADAKPVSSSPTARPSRAEPPTGGRIIQAKDISTKG
jgi:hypothetical protein